MRIVVWVLVGILAPSVLLIGVLSVIGLVRRFQIARTHRELERMGFVVSLPYAPDTPPIWPRLVAGAAGLLALIVTTSVLAASPSGRIQASGTGPSVPGAAVRPPAVPNPASEPSAPQHPPASRGGASPPASASSPASQSGSDGVAPPAVTAHPASSSEVQLAWEPVSGAGGYSIERSTDAVAWNEVGSTVGETSYTDGELSSGTTYFYRVVPLVDGQAAEPSAVVTVTTVGTSPAPVLISATASATSVDLVWSDVEGEIGYRIERSPDGASGWMGIGTTVAGVTSYTDGGLATMTTYSYRVVALTPGGESPPSGMLSATTHPEVPPASGASGTALDVPKLPA